MRGIQHILGEMLKYSLLVCLSISALGQQSPGLSLYHLNNLYFNPAAAGAIIIKEDKKAEALKKDEHQPRIL